MPYPTPFKSPETLRRRAREYISWRPLKGLWNLEGISPRVIARRTWRSLVADHVFGSAAQLGYWFLFALFPMLASLSSIIGLAARGRQNYDRMLHFLALVIPSSAFGFVYQTFNQIASSSNSDKVALGLIGALWAGSAGFSAIQDSMNAIYKVKPTRPFWKMRGEAVLVSIVLSLLLTTILGELLVAGFIARLATLHIWHHTVAASLSVLVRIAGWAVATALVVLLFALIYYWAPDVQRRKWRLLTPGSAIGIVGWVLVSIGLRVYLHFFNDYTDIYGSLAAVIILLTWFYLSGLMLLLGGEVNSEIEAAAAEKRLAALAELAPMP